MNIPSSMHMTNYHAQNSCDICAVNVYSQYTDEIRFKIKKLKNEVDLNFTSEIGLIALSVISYVDLKCYINHAI